MDAKNRNTIRRVGFALLISLLTSCPALAAEYGDITVNVELQPKSDSTHGYGEYRVAITNASPSRSHVVELTLPDQNYQQASVTRTVSVQPGSTARVSLFASSALYGNGMRVSIDGQQQRPSVQVDFPGYGYDSRPLLLVSDGASDKAFVFNAAKFLKNADGSRAFKDALSEIPVQEWSTNWLGYSRYDGVVVTDDELNKMSPETLGALIRYVECGGCLVVSGNWDGPGEWRTSSSTSALFSYYPGFGECIVTGTDSFDKLDNGHWLHIGMGVKNTFALWNPTAVGMHGGPNTTFPVTENLGVPVRGLLLMMLVFVLVIGPLNLYILSKKKRKIWLLWTVPLISLMTCVAVSAYSLFSEGWSARARHAGFTILDERSHRATTIGISAFYSPLTPSDGLRYSTDTEVISAVNWWRSYSYESDQRSAAIDWTDGQHLASGWVIARSPAHFRVRRTETRRERLTVQQDGNGQVTIVNGLGAPIKELWVADARGNVHKSGRVEAGASATLARDSQLKPSGSPTSLRGAFSSDWIDLGSSPENAIRMLRPGTYVANMENAPFLEEGLKGVKEKRSDSVVFGIMKLDAN